jgi:hypothetical protein
MKALRFPSQNQMQVVDLPQPEPDRDEALVRVYSSGMIVAFARIENTGETPMIPWALATSVPMRPGEKYHRRPACVCGMTAGNLRGALRGQGPPSQSYPGRRRWWSRGLPSVAIN